MEPSTGELVGELLRKIQVFDAWHEEAVTRLQRQASRLREQAGRLIQLRAGDTGLAELAAELERQGEQLTEEAAAKRTILDEAETLRAALAERDQRLAALEGVAGQADRFGAAETALAEKGQRIAALEAAEARLKGLLEDESARSGAAQAALAERDRRIAALEAAEAQLKGVLEKVTSKANAAQAALAEKDQRTAELEAAAAWLKQALEKESSSLNTVRAALSDKDQRVAELEAVEAQSREAHERAAQLDGALAALTEKDLRIAELEVVEAQLEEAQQRAAQLDAALADLAEKDRLLSGYSEEMECLNAESGALHERLESAEEERSRAELEKKMLLVEIEKLQMQVSENAELRGRIARLEAELEGERTRSLRALRARTQTEEPSRTAAKEAPPRARLLDDAFPEISAPLPPPVPRREKARGPNDVAAVVNSARGRGQRRQVGEILVDAGIMTQEQFDESIRMQAADPHKRIGQIIVDLGYATEEVIAATLAAQLRSRYVEDIEREMTAEAMRMVPQHIVVNHRCVPLVYDSGQLTVALANPLDLIAIEDLQHATGAYIEIVVATARAIERVIAKYYMKKIVIK